MFDQSQAEAHTCRQYWATLVSGNGPRGIGDRKLRRGALGMGVRMHLLKGQAMNPANAASGRENVKFDLERVNRLVADLAAEVERAPAAAKAG